MGTEDFTVDRIAKTKYAVVGLVQRGDKENKLVGYFLGMRSLVDTNVQIINKEDIYVWLMKGETVHILNLNQYKIDSIEVNIDNSATKYSATKEVLNLERLGIVQEAFVKAGTILPNGLVDTDKFSDVPADVKKIVEDDVKTTYKDVSSRVSTDTKTGIGSQHSPITRAAAGYTNPHTAHTVYKKKVISTTTFKRTTKYPITVALEKMQEKVAAIQDGTYDPPKLPEIPGDKEEQQVEKKDDALTEEQQYYEEVYGGMGCGIPYG